MQLKDSDAVFLKGFVQSQDPGACGARLFWVHPETGVLKIRNEKNDDWTVVGAAVAELEPGAERRREDKGREPDRRRKNIGRQPERGRR